VTIVILLACLRQDGGDTSQLPTLLRSHRAFIAALALVRSVDGVQCFMPRTTGLVSFEHLGQWEKVFDYEMTALRACTAELAEGADIPEPPELAKKSTRNLLAV